MTKERINRIEINWRGLFKTIHGLQTGPEDAPVINEIVIMQEIIPIIFVPGIMGSRLKYKPEDQNKKDEKPKRAWDPDSSWFMLTRYGLPHVSASNRKRKLIGEQSHDPAYLAVNTDNDKIPDGTDKNGWGGVFWKSYGKIIKAIAGHGWPEPLHACFHFPVYAFGYNWTASSAESGIKLAAFIKKKIGENAENSECTQVILVTHSMGGLVAREACRQEGIQDKVLGVVHGVQPATGSPAAYFRMKTGFEPPAHYNDKFWNWLRNPLKPPWETFKGKMANHVLGNYGPDVTIVMANSPGALELLPNKLYRDNNGSAQWLNYTDDLGKRSEYPQKDPYSDIYSVYKPAYRLVNPEWLGDTSGSKKKNRYEIKGNSGWEYYTLNIDKAEKFHDDLADKLHPETYQFYATDLETVDRVEIEGKKKIQEGRRLFPQVMDKTKFIMEIRDETGEKILTPENYAHTKVLEGKHCLVYYLKPPAGSGDGTVPNSSGKALKAKASSYVQTSEPTVDINENDESFYNRKHDDIYNTKTAKRITLKAIENLCKYKIKKETGAA
jgi:pimeloyl-ACP methyl ester carboxylesterase